MIKIVAATSTPDFECISELANIIWHEHYPTIISLEQIHYMLDKFNSAWAIQEQIQTGTLFFTMTYNGEPAGYLAVKKEDGFLFIAKLYVLKAFRGLKIAKTAMQFVESMAKKGGLLCLKLNVNKHNTKSIDAYERLGFVKTKSMITDIGDGYVMDDYEMTRFL